MKRRRVTVSPSKAPGIQRSAVYFDLGSLRAEATTARTISTGGGIQASAGALARAVPDRPRARLPCGPRRLGIALGVRLRGARDHAGQDLDRVEVAELGQAGQARARRDGRRRAARGRDPRAAARGPRRSAGGSPRRSPRPARRSRGRPARRARRPVWDRSRCRRADHRSAGRSPPAPRARSLDLRERGGRGLERALDVLGRVGEAREPGLELRRRRVDAARQQRAAPGGVGLACRRRRRPRSRSPARRRRRRSAARASRRPGPGGRPRPRAGRRRARASCRRAGGRPPRRGPASAASPAATASGFPLSVPAW